MTSFRSTLAIISTLAALTSSVAAQHVETSQHGEFTTAKPSCEFNHDVNRINGHVPPGQLAHLADVTTMLNTIMQGGSQLIVTKGIRKAGTRVGIHVHDYGGHTCVMTGAITDFVEGRAPAFFPAGTCYYMPPCTPMTAANLGTEDAILIDTFIVPPGAPTIHVIEPAY